METPGTRPNNRYFATARDRNCFQSSHRQRRTRKKKNIIGLVPITGVSSLCGVSRTTVRISYTATQSRLHSAPRFSLLCCVLHVVLSWCLRFGVHRGKTLGTVPMTGFPLVMTCVPVIALHSTPHGALHALVRACSLRVPCRHALLGPGLLRKHQGAASRYVESGGFGMTSCERSISLNTRSIRRKRPLSEIVPGRRSELGLEGWPQHAARRRGGANHPRQACAERAGHHARQSCTHRNASWPRAPETKEKAICAADAVSRQRRIV